MAIRATAPESLSAGCGDDVSVLDWLLPATRIFTEDENENMHMINSLPIEIHLKSRPPPAIVNVCSNNFLPSSIHVCSSLRSFNPVGHAHEIFALCASICGAGKHKCEQ